MTSALQEPTTILHLPSELLDLIFFFLVNLSDPPAFYPARGQYRAISLSWLGFLQVCRRFKYVGIKCHGAWAEACTQFPSLPCIVNDRAGDALRRVVARRGYPNVLIPGGGQDLTAVENFLNNVILQGNLDRQTHTILAHPPYQVCQFALDLFKNALKTGAGPKELRCLDLKYDLRGESSLTELHILVRESGESVMVCPVLREVRLDGIWIPVKSGKLEKMDLRMRAHLPRPSVKGLCAVLAGHADQLQRLHLHDAFALDEAFAPDDAEDSSDLVALTQLGILDLRATVREAHQLFRLVALSPSIEIVRLSIYESCDADKARKRLPKLNSLRGTYNKFKVIYDCETALTLTLHAWRKTPTPFSRTLADLEERNMHPLVSDFTLVYNFLHGQSMGLGWRTVLASFVKAVRCDSEPAELSLTLPEKFINYAPGQTRWNELQELLGPVFSREP